MNLLPGSPNGDPLSKMFVSRTFFYIPPEFPIKHGLLINQNLTFLSKSLVKQPPPSMSPQWGPHGDSCSVSRANSLFIHSFISPHNYHSPQLRTSPMKKGENIWSPSMEPHVDRTPTYNRVLPGSPTG